MPTEITPAPTPDPTPEATQRHLTLDTLFRELLSMTDAERKATPVKIAFVGDGEFQDHGFATWIESINDYFYIGNELDD